MSRSHRFASMPRSGSSIPFAIAVSRAYTRAASTSDMYAFNHAIPCPAGDTRTRRPRRALLRAFVIFADPNANNARATLARISVPVQARNPDRPVPHLLRHLTGHRSHVGGE